MSMWGRAPSVHMKIDTVENLTTQINVYSSALLRLIQHTCRSRTLYHCSLSVTTSEPNEFIFKFPASI